MSNTTQLRPLTFDDTIEPPSWWNPVCRDSRAKFRESTNIPVLRIDAGPGHLETYASYPDTWNVEWHADNKRWGRATMAHTVLLKHMFGFVVAPDEEHDRKFFPGDVSESATEMSYPGLFIRSGRYLNVREAGPGLEDGGGGNISIYVTPEIQELVRQLIEKRDDSPKGCSVCEVKGSG